METAVSIVTGAAEHHDNKVSRPLLVAPWPGQSMVISKSRTAWAIPVR